MNTMQKEFDIVVNHLFKQGRPCKIAENADCLYKYKGMSCAVGCRITSKMYRAWMEGQNITTLVENHPEKLRPEIIEYVDMFYSLQSAHDYCTTTDLGNFDMGHLKIRFEEVAKSYGLIFKQPKGIQ